MSFTARTKARPEDSDAPLWKRRLGWLAGLAMVVTACLAVRSAWGPLDAAAERNAGRAVLAPRESAKQTRGPSAGQQNAAIVNGDRITREALAQACLARYGESVLEALVNKRLIGHYCKRRGINVTGQEIESEIDRIARRFRLEKEQYLKMLKEERGVSHRQYAQDILWPKLALQKLASGQIAPTEEEIQKAYETEFGPAVRARILVVSDAAQARALHQQLTAQPGEFARLAREHSKDINSASNGGLIQPIRSHVGDPHIERAVFAMQPGGISPVLQVGGQLVIVKCEARIPARAVPFEEARANLEQKVRDRKLREGASNLFRQLQDDARIENIYNDPQRRQSMPGIVATINDEPITMRELAEECLALHGEKVIEKEINAALLKQELHRRDLKVTQADLDAEIMHAAELNGVVDSAGRADIGKWLEMATKDQGITQEVYIRSAVWPSAALKKMTHGKVTVDKEDMQKGFEANYGPRVRCRAIVMTNQRRTQEVWDKARQKPTVEFFGKLAQEYSVEAGSRSRHGEVPPIRRHGGQPLLEEQAFALKPGELSGVIQSGSHYVILFCEGYTEPVNVQFGEVEPMIYRDLFEKKLRLAMHHEFEEIKQQAQIDNFLAGTTQSPKRASRGNSSAQSRTAPSRDVSNRKAAVSTRQR